MSSLSPKSLCRERESCWVNIATTGVCFPDALARAESLPQKAIGPHYSLLNPFYSCSLPLEPRTHAPPLSLPPPPLMSLPVFTSLSFLFGTNKLSPLTFPCPILKPFTHPPLCLEYFSSLCGLHLKVPFSRKPSLTP